MQTAIIRSDRSRPRVRVAITLALLASVSVAAGPANAQIVGQSEGRAGALMAVPVNKSQVLNLDRAFAKALIGNPEIADVMPLTASSVYVLGRKTGSTNLALYDRGGKLIAVVDVVVGPDTQGLKRLIAQTFPGEDVRITNSNDSVMLEGQVSSPLAAERIVAMAQTYAPEKVLNLMSVGSPQQVLLEVRVSEMSRGTVKELGISSATWSTGGIGRTRLLQSGPFVGFLTGIFGTTLDIEFEALERRGLVRTLANPNLVALSGETANFLAGGEFPIPTGVDSQGRVAIEFKQFGVALAFTPTVLADGMVNLRVAPEVSSIDREVSIELDGFTIPGLKVRRAVTSLELRDGQSFAMAGLIQSDFTDTVRAIPLLGKIPIIGALFRSTSFNKQETELVITVTPRIVRPVKPDQIALPTDRVQPPTSMELFLLGKTQDLQPVNKAAKPSASAAPGGIDGDQGHIVR
ncbi:MAG: type II and III secretion system protein family protein [Sandaracinobacteroides sp.]